MPERKGFPAGVPAWIDAEHTDTDAAATFYGGLFGWEFEDRGSGGSGAYLVATLDGRDVAAVAHVAPGSSGASPAWNTYVGVEDADAVVDRIREAGGTVLSPPRDVGDAGRAASCADPAGARFRVWQPGSIAGAEVVNAPGTWNFSELRTRDVEGARRFYGAVFGWETDEVDMGALTGTMIRLPGYADFLEQFDPGLRKRHADFGAPPGFSDCIAWVLPLDEGDDPHWSITFSVADTDAVVARAKELGGSVLVEPYDVPPVRTAVLRDPAGAVFTVSAFAPA